jgi:hypothetical protein
LPATFILCGGDIAGGWLASFARMTTIEIEPLHRGADVTTDVQRALAVLRKAGIKVRRRVRSLEMMGLIQVPDADAGRAISLLVAANIRAAIRPS